MGFRKSSAKGAVPQLFAVRQAGLTAWLVLLTGLLLTALLWHFAVQAEYRNQHHQLRYDASQAVNIIEQRFAQYDTLVRSGQALFAGSERVEPEEWQAFTRSLDLESGYPGLTVLAFFRYLPSEQARERYLAEQSATGRPVSIFPPGRRDFYCVMSLYGPELNDAREIGFDACSAPAPREAFLMARTSGRVTLSAPLFLIENQDRKSRGYALVAPVYAEAEGRQTVYGWVGAPLPAEGVFSGVVDSGSGISFEVLDGTQSVYRQSAGSAAPTESLGQGMLTVEEVVRPGGRRWLLRFDRRFSIGALPWLVMVSGVVISVLLFLLLAAWSRTREEALKLAEEMTAALQESEQLLSSITNNISEGIYRGEPGRGLVYVNPALAEMFGYSSPEAMLEASGHSFYAEPGKREELRALLERDGQYRNQEVEYRRRDGSRFIGINNAVAIRDESGAIIHYDGAIYDITERKLAEERVYYLAHYDPLTGLPNRSLLRERMESAMLRARQLGTRLGLLFIDLDHFKNINDSLGHSAGDLLLCEVADRLSDGLRASDMVSRQGGDEFILLVDNLRRTEDLAAIADKLIERISQPFDIEGHHLLLTPSIGITVYPDDGASIEELIRNADAAMYHAKENGRNNYQFFRREMSAGALARLSLESAMRKGLERGEFELHYQPQVSLSDGRISGVEALLRWRHPERGLLPPGEFIHIAEQSGFIVELGDWVIDEACRQAAAWDRQGHEPLRMAVNISGMQFRRGHLGQVVAEALEASGLPADRLELELTESVLMRYSQTTRSLLNQLHHLGVRLAVDDFGTGYSSLSYLKRFRVDRLKIDQSFIGELDVHPDDEAIARAVIQMARALRLEVVAEGVERETQLAFLRAEGCDAVQGYLFSRALPAGELARLLAGGKTYSLDAHRRSHGSQA